MSDLEDAAQAARAFAENLEKAAKAAADHLNALRRIHETLRKHYER